MNKIVNRMVLAGFFLAGVVGRNTIFDLPEAHADNGKNSGSATSAGQSSRVADKVSPRDKVEGTIDSILKVVQEIPGDDKAQQRRAKLRELINPRFDFAEMAQRSLGPYWNDISNEERSESVDVFSDLLARTYLNRIETIKPGMVKIESEDLQGGGANAVVKTSVTNKGDTFPINYKLLNKNGQWKVYDVVIENIGLVQNYRNEFASIIRREKMSGLIRKLREKNAAA